MHIQLCKQDLVDRTLFSIISYFLFYAKGKKYNGGNLLSTLN